MDGHTKARLEIFGAMFLWGTTGLFARWIPLPTDWMALVRGFLGALLLFAFYALRGHRPDWAAIRKNWPYLFASGATIGVNWILLFEAYRATTIAIATLCYYTAPAFVMLASPLVLGEKLTHGKLLALAGALLGIALVSGFWETTGTVNPRGIFLGLGAAMLYASITLLNKKVRDIDASDCAIPELFTTSAVLLPYILLKPEGVPEMPGLVPVLLLVTLGLAHTGLAFLWYFSGLKTVSAQTAALMSYLDPLTAVLCSLFVLAEPASPSTLAGAALILGSTLLAEMKKD